MEPQHKPVGAPERLDVPFELKAIQTLTGDDGVEVGVFEGLASTFGNRDMMGDVVEPGAFVATSPAVMQPQTTSSKTLRRISLSRKRP